jgi:hypothetical protein
MATALGVLLTSLCAGSSAAYGFIDYCNGNPVGWYYGRTYLNAASASFPSGGSWYNALLTAVRRLNDNPSPFYFTLYTGDTSVAIGNGENEVWFSSSSAHTPAVAYNWATCYWSGTAWQYWIDETDIVFYNGIAYTADMTASGLWPYGGPRRPFQTTAVHELGHGMGLGHVASEYNVMGQDYRHLHANGGVARAYLGEDAADGAIRLYGSHPIEDVSLAHWKRTGASGAYSTHGRTELYGADGALLPSSLVAGEPRFDVQRGQVVQMELTGENNGRSAQTPRIHYYVSTNNAITTTDRLIHAESRSLTRANVDTYRVTLTVPSDLVPGDYWLGAIVDATNAIAERVEDNNATYIAIRVN